MVKPAPAPPAPNTSPHLLFVNNPLSQLSVPAGAGQRASSHIPEDNDTLLNSVLTDGSLRTRRKGCCGKNMTFSAGTQLTPTQL